MIKLGDGAAIDSLILTFVRFVTMALSIVCTKILSVKFSLEDFGTYSQALLIVSTFSSFSILGLTDATNYFYNSLSDSLKQKVVSSIFLLQFVVGLFVAISILLCQNIIIDYFNNPELGEFILWLSVMPMASNLLAMLQIMYVSLGKTKIIAIRNFVVSLIRLCIFVVVSYYFKNILFVFILISICDIIQVGYFFIGIHHHGVKLDFSIPSVKNIMMILSYSIPMAIYVVMNALLRDIDKLMVGNLSSTENLAIYANSSRVLPFDVFTASLITVLIPFITKFISSKDYKSVTDILANYINLAVIITGILTLSMVCYADGAVVFLYSEQYLPGLSIFVLYIIVDFLRVLNISFIFSTVGKTKLLLGMSFVMLILNIVLNYVFYLKFGLVGPAISTVCVILLSNFYIFYKTSAIIHFPSLKLVRIKKIFAIILQCIVSFFLIDRFKQLLGFTDSYNVFVFLISYSLQVCILLLLNFRDIMRHFRSLNSFR